MLTKKKKFKMLAKSLVCLLIVITICTYSFVAVAEPTTSGTTGATVGGSVGGTVGGASAGASAGASITVSGISKSLCPLFLFFSSICQLIVKTIGGFLGISA